MLLGLAPMDGITDCPYRIIVEKIFNTYKNSKDILQTWTEFMSADGYMINPSRLIKHLIKTEGEQHLTAQIYGGNRDTLIKTAQDICIKYPSFAGIELNIGCPSPKVMICGAGAGMMKDKQRTLAIIKDLSQASTLPFSIKTRLGLTDDDRDAQYKFIVKASEYCSTIIIHARTFKQGHSGEVDRETLYQLRKDINPNCFLIGNGGITSYEKAQQAATISDGQGAEIGIMIGQAAIGNPRIFTPHRPTDQERIQTCLDHLYLMTAYEIYLDHTRLSFPEESDQLALNRKHIHISKKYDPNSDEASDIPSLERHDYLFPMPSEKLLHNYSEIIQQHIKKGENIVNFGEFIRDINHLRTGIDIRKYLFNYIQGIPNNKFIKQQITNTKKVSEVSKILQSLL